MVTTRTDTTHTVEQKKEKLLALIAAVKQLNKDTQKLTNLWSLHQCVLLKHRIESLKILAEEAESCLNSKTQSTK